MNKIEIANEFAKIIMQHELQNGNFDCIRFIDGAPKFCADLAKKIIDECESHEDKSLPEALRGELS